MNGVPGAGRFFRCLHFSSQRLSATLQGFWDLSVSSKKRSTGISVCSAPSTLLACSSHTNYHSLSFGSFGRTSGATSQFPGMQPPILIVSPPFNHNSAGIRVLHELADSLVSLNYKAYIIILNGARLSVTNDKKFFSDSLKRTPCPLDQKAVENLIQTGILVCPEVFTGNPLGAPRVIRWFLNKEGAVLGNPTNCGPDDYIITFSKLFRADAHDLLFKISIPNFFNDTGARPHHERTLDVTYEGKGTKYTNTFTVENSIKISRDWPASPQELALLLKNCRYFFSWDAVSHINAEAVMCGAIPVILQWSQISRSEIAESEIGVLPMVDCRIESRKVFVDVNYTAYDEERKLFIHRIDAWRNSWETNVRDVFERAKAHFKL
jgi:hypothetical protein